VEPQLAATARPGLSLGQDFLAYWYAGGNNMNSPMMAYWYALRNGMQNRDDRGMNKGALIRRLLCILLGSAMCSLSLRQQPDLALI
jgi:hypothetical protein